jgi:hypothetical protein
LDRIALALDLAGGRIQDDIDGRIDLDGTAATQQDNATLDTKSATTAAIEQYFLDLKENTRNVLENPEQNNYSTCTKTIWTVWETVLTGLEQSEQSLSDATLQTCSNTWSGHRAP